MSWHEAFRAAFFGEWVRAGLPESSSTRTPAMAWPQIRCELVSQAPVEQSGKLPRALDPAVLDSVYGFGVFIGDAFGVLAGMPAAQRRARSGVCGRFNLGISLFDFVCDEAGAEEFARLRQLPSLRLFTGGSSAAVPQGPTLEFLDGVVSNVLGSFVSRLGVPSTKRPQGLWRALFDMFAAEMARAALRSDVDGPPLPEVRRLLRLSASEPFRVMAEWMALGLPPTPLRSRRAIALGRAVGDCFWLVDDAKDVWQDLHAHRWNLLLVEAKRADPSLDFGNPSPLLEYRLMDVWRRDRAAQRGARRTIGALARALQESKAGRRQVRLIASRLHAAMRAWCE